MCCNQLKKVGAIIKSDGVIEQSGKTNELYFSEANRLLDIIINYTRSFVLVNQFKAHQINNSRKKIVHIKNIRKGITTTGDNTFDKIISVRKWPTTDDQLKQIFGNQKTKYIPFKK